MDSKRDSKKKSIWIPKGIPKEFHMDSKGIPYGFQKGFQKNSIWIPQGIPKEIHMDSKRIPYGFPMDFLSIHDGVPVNLQFVPTDFQGIISVVFPARIPCGSPIGFLMDFRWIAYGSPMDFRLICNGSPVDSRWISYGVSIGFL